MDNPYLQAIADRIDKNEAIYIPDAADGNKFYWNVDQAIKMELYNFVKDYDITMLSKEDLIWLIRIERKKRFMEPWKFLMEF